MVRSLLSLAVLAALLSITAAPLHAQSLFLDENRNGVCDDEDHPSANRVDTLDVWIDTSKNFDGSPATCSTGEDLTMSSYELILLSDPGTTILSWTNLRPEFPIEEHKTLQAGVSWIGYTSSGATTHLPPGKYLLGKGVYQTTPGICPYIFIAPQSAAFPAAETKFYSHCLGSQLDNYIRYGTDFVGTCGGIAICVGVKPTTWGHIKDIYR